MNKTFPLQGLTYASFSDGFDHCFQLSDDVHHYMEIKRCGSQTLKEFLAESINQGTKFTYIIHCTLVPWVAVVARVSYPSLAPLEPTCQGYDKIISNDMNDPSFLTKHLGVATAFLSSPNSLDMPFQAYKEHIGILEQETNPRALLRKSRGKWNGLDSKPESSVICVSFGSPSVSARLLLSDGYDQGINQSINDVNHYIVEIKRCGFNTLREFIAQSINQGTRTVCLHFYCTLPHWVSSKSLT
ncbi:hypothetical protein QQP08_000846 [Theobroma cacao]|nr:hypothetical protein QQP08_000846 [Theobroma cacao]